MSWRQLLREPLVHFLLAGAAVFVLLSGRAPDVGERRIVVDEAVVSRLADRFVQNFRRAPSAAELDGLIAEHVKDEVYYREALRLGLDRDDEVVRRRLRNKMTELAVAPAEAATPADADLQRLIAADPARYAAPPRYDLEQLYLGADTPQARGAAPAVLAKLRRGEAVSLPLVDLPLPRSYRAAGADALAEQFGDAFAAALAKAPEGQWSGPVASGLGLHLVRVERAYPSPPPSLAAVRERVSNDWRADKLRRAEGEGYDRLLAGYDVVIDASR